MRVGSRPSIGLSDHTGPLSNMDDVVDRIMAPASEQVEASKQRRTVDVERNQSLQTYSKLLADLSGTADRMKRPIDFQKLTAESSRSDILDASVSGAVDQGQYEFEVSGIAKRAQILSQGFPDKDKTSVGLGYLTLTTGDGDFGVAIPAGSNLMDVAAKINETGAGVRATIINTGAKGDAFRLMVTSAKTGEEAIVSIDPDTTFLEFPGGKPGVDLQATFEGVPLRQDSNELPQLLDGLHLRALKADPGATVSVAVRPDMDKTAGEVREFVQQYNQVHQFGQKRPHMDLTEADVLTGDRTVRQASRALQSAIQEPGMVDIGITTDPKTGELRLDESKLKYSLANNYERVVNLFTSNGQSVGPAEKMSQAIKKLQDKTSGALGVRLKGMDERIRRQDGEIARKEEQVQNRRAALAAKFASLNTRIEAMNAESDILVQRLGASPPSSQA